MMPHRRHRRDSPKGMQMGQLVGSYFSRTVHNHIEEGPSRRGQVIPFQPLRQNDTFDEDNMRPPIHCMGNFMFPLAKAQCNKPIPVAKDVLGIPYNESLAEPDSMVVYSMPSESEASSDSTDYDRWSSNRHSRDVDEIHHNNRCTDMMILPTVSEMSGVLIGHLRGRPMLAIEKGPDGNERSHRAHGSEPMPASDTGGIAAQTPPSYRALFLSNTDSTAGSTSDSDEEDSEEEDDDDYASDDVDESSISDSESCEDSSSYGSEGSSPFDEPDSYEYREVISVTPSICSHIYIEKRPTGDGIETSFEMVPVDHNDEFDDKTFATISDVTDSHVAQPAHPMYDQHGTRPAIDANTRHGDIKSHDPFCDQKHPSTATMLSSPVDQSEDSKPEGGMMERRNLDMSRLHLANIPEDNLLGTPVAHHSTACYDKGDMMLAQLDRAIEETMAKVRASREYSARSSASLSMSLDSPTSQSTTNVECFLHNVSNQDDPQGIDELRSNPPDEAKRDMLQFESMAVNGTNIATVFTEEHPALISGRKGITAVEEIMAQVHANKGRLSTNFFAPNEMNKKKSEPIPDLVEPESTSSETFEEVPTALSTTTKDMYSDDFSSKPKSSNMNSKFAHAATPKTRASRNFGSEEMFLGSMPNSLTRTESGSSSSKKELSSSGMYLTCPSTLDEFVDTIPYSFTPQEAASFEDVCKDWVGVVASFEQHSKAARKLTQTSAAFLSFDDEDAALDTIPNIITGEDESDNRDELMSFLTFQDAADPEQSMYTEAKDEIERPRRRLEWEIGGRIILMAVVVHLWNL